MNDADHVTQVLASHGRQVSPDSVRADLQSLSALGPDDAVRVELATFGISSDGRPTRSFVPDRSALASWASVVRESPGAFLYVIAAAAVGLVPAVAVPLLLRLFVNRWLLENDAGWGIPVLLGLAAAAALSTAIVVVQFAVIHRSALRMSRMSQTGFAWHVLNLPIPTVQRLGAGELIARLSAGQRVAFQGGGLMPLAIANVVSIVAYLVVLFALNLWMGVSGLAVALLMFAASLIVLRWRRRAQSEADAGYSELSGTTAEILTGIESIKAAGWEQFAFRRWTGVRARTARAISRLGVGNQWLALIPAVALALGMGLVLAIGSLEVIRGNLSLGSLIASQSFVAMLLTAVGLLVYMGTLVQSIISGTQQTDQVLRERVDPEVVSAATEAHGGDGTRLRGDVRLTGVTFGYDRSSAPLISDLDLTIPAGSQVALVGRSGSGKTTIAKLVIGELAPWTGAVELDGSPRLLVPRDQRTSSIAYVPQQSVLFPGTVIDNLTMWDEQATHDAVRAASDDACISEAVLGRPDGFHAQVRGADGGFSGGELQRLSIARALTGAPSILVLDEATSALDPVVEAEVAANLRRRGCTCLIVAHRLSTIRDADEILVIDAGSVVQRGRYEDIRDHGFFAELIHG